MGTWGPNAFDNDSACDWALELEGCDDLALIEASLRQALENSIDGLESPEGETGIAACEAVARLRGNFGVRSGYTEELDRWVEAHAHLDFEPLLPVARKVIERVVADNSELAACWAESEFASEWRAAIEDLRSRLA